MNYIFFIYLWPSMFSLLESYYNPTNSIERQNRTKLVRHYISSVNLILLLIFTPLYILTNKEVFFELSKKTSITYLVWDLYYIIINKTNEYQYIFHHFAGLLLWNWTFKSPEFKLPVILLYGFSELSNIPMFIIYYLLKILDQTKIYNLKTILYWKYIQVISFGPIRLLLIPYLTRDYFFKMPTTLFIVIILMMLMMLYWEVHIIRSYLKEKEQYKKLIKSQ